MNNQNQGYPNSYGQPNNVNVPQSNPTGYQQQPMGYQQQPQMNPQPGYYSPQPTINNNQTSNNGNKKMFAIIGIIIAVAAIAIVCILFFGNKKTEPSNQKNNRPEPTMERTIMIYMVGSNLEEGSDKSNSGGNASSELGHINPANIDLANNNVIMIAGGSKKWFNDYIDPEETSIFQLKANGFEKINRDTVKNMGDPKTLSDFLNYVYDEFPSKKYELIFWDHGSGAIGLETDTIYGDMIYLKELEQALKDSPFGPEEKLDSILFINCLLGNIQIAGIIDDYADYMIASEEVSYTSPLIDKFKFLENIEKSDTGVEFGKKFIDNLVNNTPIVAGATANNTPTTYSIIDLSKVKQIETALNNFVQSININQAYSTIAYARSNMFQYGVMTMDNGMVDSSYDMIDLYTLVSSIQNLSPSEANKLLDSLNTAIVYNYSNDNNSKGLSTYFPYRGEKSIVDLHVRLLTTLDGGSSNAYLTFIQNFDLYKRTNSSYFMDITSNQVNSIGNDYSMQFSDAQKKNFANASYMIFKQTEDGAFIPIYFSDNTTLDANGKLKANFDGKIVTVTNPSTNVKEPIFVSEQQNGNYRTNVQLTSSDNSKTDAYVSIKFAQNDGTIEAVVEKENTSLEDTKLPSMALLTLENYQTISFINSDYQITDGKGLMMDTWKVGNSYSTDALVRNYKIEKTALNKNEKYYFVFKVCDLSNEVTYSQLVLIK